MRVWTRLLRQDERDLAHRQRDLDGQHVHLLSERIDIRRRHRDRALDGVIWAQSMLCRYGVQAVEDWANSDAANE